MNHAFLVEAHDSPELLQRIVNKIQAPNHYVFIHFDKKYPMPTINIKWGGLIPDRKRISVTWGGYSQIKATLILLEEAINNHINFDYYHLISGHDYPCVDNVNFDRFFDQVPQGRSFMLYDTDLQLAEDREAIRWRVNKWHFHEDKDNTIFERKYHFFLQRYIKRRYKGNLYKGSNWFSWHSSLAQWVLQYLKWHPVYLHRFHYTMCCDEVIFHTLLYPYIERFNIEKNNDLRYVDWTPIRPSKTLPPVLDEEYIDVIKHSGSLFCRKVTLENSLALLEMLDVNEVIPTFMSVGSQN